MESYLFKAHVDSGFSLGGSQLYSNPSLVVSAADRLIHRMRRGNIVSVKVSVKATSL